MTALTSFLVALLFAAIFLFGGQWAYRPGQKGRRRFLSFAAGIAVAYVFVDVMPGLSRLCDIVMQEPSGFRRFFPEYSVYLWALAGFLAFYCLETLVVRPQSGPGHHGGSPTKTPAWQAWVHIGGFAAYTGLLSYLMVWKRQEPLTLFIYALAMGMHLFPIACDLHGHYPAVYEHRGALLLAVASVAGWGAGLALEIPAPLLANLVAVVAGGVIVNTAIAELPKEGEGRQGAFLTGALVYTALLLTLSHFEHGGAN
jgi:hypothetical protein